MLIVLHKCNNSCNITAVNGGGVDTIWFYNGTDNETYTSEVYRTFSEGSNTLIAYANDTSDNVGSGSVVFNVDTITPTISIESPLNQTYSNATILVNITSDGDYVWFYNGTDNDNNGKGDIPHVLYENNTDNYPLMNPVAIPDFPSSSPPLTPEQTEEPTQSPEPQSEPFPTVPVAAFLGSVAVVAVGLVICFRKRKGEAKPS